MLYLRVGKCLVHRDEIRYVEPKFVNGKLAVTIGYPNAMDAPLTGSSALAFAHDFKAAGGRDLIEMATFAADDEPKPVGVATFLRYLKVMRVAEYPLDGAMASRQKGRDEISDDDYLEALRLFPAKVVHIDGYAHIAHADWDGPRSTKKPAVMLSPYGFPMPDSDDDTADYISTSKVGAA